jgi:hypothetical protein
MSEVVCISAYNGKRKVAFTQPTAARKPVARNEKYFGNQDVQRRLVAAIQTSVSLTSLARILGGADVALIALKKYTERRAA